MEERNVTAERAELNPDTVNDALAVAAADDLEQELGVVVRGPWEGADVADAADGERQDVEPVDEPPPTSPEQLDDLRDDLRRAALQLATRLASSAVALDHPSVVEARANVATLDEQLRRAIAGRDWPDAPIPLFTGGPSEPLDLDRALPLELGTIVEHFVHEFGVHETVPLSLLLTFISAAAGNGWEFRASRSHVEPSLSHFRLCILDPGERKSPVFRPFVRAFDDEWLRSTAAEELGRQRSIDIARREAARKRIQKLQAERMETDDRQRQLELDVEIQDRQRDIDAPLSPSPRFWGDDVTSQAVQQILEATGGTFSLVTPEGRDFIANLLGAYRADRRPDDAVFLRVHGGDALSRDRASVADAHVEHPGGAIAVLVQSDIFGDLAKSRPLKRGGFLARLHVCRPPRMVGQRFPDDDDLDFTTETELDAGAGPEEIGRLHDMLRSIVATRYAIASGEGRPRTLALERDARPIARAWQNELEARQAQGGDLADDSDRASKLYGEALRVAGLLHLALHPDPDTAHRDLVSGRLWEHARYIAEWSFRETRRAIEGATSGSWASWALSLWAYADRNDKGRGPFLASEIATWRVGDCTKAAWVTDRLRWLAELGWTRELPPEPGKRAERWFLREESPSC